MNKDIAMGCCSHGILGCLAIVMLSVAMTLPAVSQSEYVWKTFARLEDGRQQFTTAWIGKDRLLVIGGKINGVGQMNGVPTTRCEVVNLATSSVSQAGAMQVPRAEHVSLVDARDSSILVIGGVTTDAFAGEVTSVIERYNPALDEWTIVGNTLIGRRQHTAYWISQTEILIVGGRAANLSSLSHAEIFDLKTKTSRRIADFPLALNSLQSITVGTYDGVVFGGRTGGPNSLRSPKGYRYEQDSDEWVEEFDLAVSVSAPTAIGTWEGPALVTGGAISETPFDSIEDTWLINNGVPTRIGEMQNGRQWHSVAQLNSDTLIAGAGYDDNIVISNTCDWVDVKTGFVRPGPSLNVERAYPVFASIPTAFRGATPTTAIVLAISGLRQDGNLEPTIEMLVKECEGDLNLLSRSVLKNLRGSATEEGGSIFLTDTSKFVAGAAWVQRKVTVYPSIDVRFSFRLHDGDDHELPDGGSPGADGVVFVLQDNVPSGVGEVGQGIGYDGIGHGLAIEFDSYRNGALSDPSTSHIAVQLGNGQKLSATHSSSNTLGIVHEGVPDFRADGTRYYARIVYASGSLSVYCSTESDPKFPLLIVDVDLKEALDLAEDGRAWIGLTSATGFSTEYHEITEWSLGGCDPLIVGLDEQQETLQPSASSLLIAPSPADQEAVVTLPMDVTGDWTLRVVSMDGRTLYTTSGPDASASPALPAAQFAPGMYAVLVTTGQRTWTTMWSVVR